MLTRIAIALFLIFIGVAAYQLGTRRQIAGITGRTSKNDILSTLRSGVPAVVYFWSESCAPCKLMQSPAIQEVVSRLGPDGVQIIEVNAIEESELASAWGVLSLPTTFIIDQSGQPRRVNHGVVRADQLERQLASLT